MSLSNFIIIGIGVAGSIAFLVCVGAVIRMRQRRRMMRPVQPHHPTSKDAHSINLTTFASVGNSSFSPGPSSPHRHLPLPIPLALQRRLSAHPQDTAPSTPPITLLEPKMCPVFSDDEDGSLEHHRPSMQRLVASEGKESRSGSAKTSPRSVSEAMSPELV